MGRGDDSSDKEFIDCVIKGKNNNEIFNALNQILNNYGDEHHDYKEF